MGFLLRWLPPLLALFCRPGAAVEGPMPIATSEGIVIASAGGRPTAIGSAVGTTLGGRIRPLMTLMRLAPGLLSPRQAARRAAAIAAIRPHHRSEIAACATTSGVAEDVLLDGHLIVDAMCSAVAVLAEDGRPLRVARNMDFFPADVLGSFTIVQCWRPDGLRAVVSVGWPGFSGVISGMNDAGLTACVLLNFQAAPLPDGGEPLPLLVRHLLETCATVDEAAAAFAAAMPGIGHYVLLADAHGACVVWREGAATRRADPVGRLLVADNEPRTDAGAAGGQRACRLGELAAQGPGDPAWLRRSLTATYLATLNAQAMLFEPQSRRLELAVGGAGAPASRQRWQAVDLAPLLRGESPVPALASPLPPHEPLPHYAGD